MCTALAPTVSPRVAERTMDPLLGRPTSCRYDAPPVAVLDQVGNAVTKTNHSAGTVLSASQSVQDAALALQVRVEDFLKKVVA